MKNTDSVMIQGVQGFKPRAPLPVRELGELRAKNFQTVTVSNTPVGLTLPAYTELFKQWKAVICVEDADIRVRIDGTNPTETIGHLIEVGDIVELDSYTDIQKFRAIRTGSTSATLTVTILEVFYERN